MSPRVCLPPAPMRWSLRAWGGSSALWSRSPTSTLRVGAGERRAVLGSNGAGKTTLFNAVTGDFPADIGTDSLLRRGCDGLSRTRTNPARPAPDLSDQPALRRIDGDRQHFRRLPRRFARPSVAAAPGQGRCDHGAGAPHRPRRSSRRYSRNAGFGAEPRPAASARNRAGAERRAAVHSVRRAGRRSFAVRSGATSSKSSTRCRRISATSSSSTISTSRCASRPM